MPQRQLDEQTIDDATEDPTCSQFGLTSTAPVLNNPAVSPYQLIRCIGSGGMGDVFEAIDSEGEQRVALKTLHHLDVNATERLKKEFRSVVNLSHPNLVRVFEFRSNESALFFTMELVDGASFYDAVCDVDLAPDKAPSPEFLSTLYNWLGQLCRALEMLHSQGVLHLDLKPKNVLIEGLQRVVVLDFGLACSMATLEKDQPRGVLGTPSYMSPEQAKALPPTEASDWYAVGVMLFQALTHRLPFLGLPSGVLQQKHSEPAPDIASLRPGIPEELVRLVNGLLSSDPEQRLGLVDVLAIVGQSPTEQTQNVEEFYGREEQLQSLNRFLRDGSAQTRMILISGPGGVGKSALARHFLGGLSQQYQIFEGRCYEWETAAFKGVDQVVESLCAFILTLPEEKQRLLLTPELVATAQIFPCLQAIAGFSECRSQFHDISDRAELRLRAFDGLGALMRESCLERPIIWFVDDLHWADPDSAQLILALFGAPLPPNLSIIGSCRNEGLQGRPFFERLSKTELLDGLPSPVYSLDVPPLSEAASCRLAQSILGEDSSESLALHIAKEAGGSPFFVEQLSRFAKTKPGMAQKIHVGAVIGHQLELLSEDVRCVLEVIAVAGRPTEQRLILQAAGRRSQSHDQLVQLRQFSMIRTHGPRAEHYVESYHDRVREGVVDLIDLPRRREIHEQLVEAFVRAESKEDDILAFHYHGAGQLKKASKHAELAAQKAESGLAFVRAASFYQDALKWSEGGADRRRRLLFRQGRALGNGGRETEAAPLFLQASMDQSDDRRRQLVRMAAECYLTSGQIDEGLALLKPLLVELGVSFPKTSTGALFSLMWQVMKLWVRGTKFEVNTQVAHSAEAILRVDLTWALGKGLSNVLPIEGADFMIRSLLGALKLGDPERAGRGLSFLSVGMATVSRKIKVFGERFLHQAEELAELTQSPHLRGFNLISRGAGELMEGNWQASLQNADAGLKVLREQCTGVSWECVIGEALAIKVLEITGELNRAFLRAKHWRREASGRGDAYAVEICDYFIGLSQLAAGNVALCRKLNDPSLKNWSEKYTVQHFYWMRLIVWCDLYEGKAKEALKRFRADEKKIQGANLLQVPLSRIEVRLLEATILLAIADETSLRRCETLAGHFEKESRLDCPVHGAMIRAAILWHRDKKEEAIAGWNQCADHFSTLKMPLPAAIAGLFLAQATGDLQRYSKEESILNSLGVAEPDGWCRTYLSVFEAWKMQKTGLLAG